MTNISYVVLEQKGRKDAHSVYAQARFDRVVPFEEVIRHIAEKSIYRESVISGVAAELKNYVLEHCGMGLGVEIGEQWLTFIPEVRSTLRDYTDQDGHLVRVTPNDLKCTPNNAIARICCKVNCVFQRLFNRNTSFNKIERKK